MIPRAGEEKKEERLPKAFLELVATLDPKLDVISKKDMLILKGDEDKLVPWEASEEFVGKLPKDKAEVVGYPGVGHAFTDTMLEKSAGWIVEWCAKH
jgi:predicted esterase